MNSRGYQKLKSSGVGWLGNVPEHWEVKGLRYICRLAYGDSLAADDRNSGDVAVYGSNGKVGLHSVSNTLGPVIVVGRKGSHGRLNYSEKNVFAIDTTYFIDQRHTKSNLRWLFYALSILRLDAVSKDSAVPGLAREDAYANLTVCPPLPEQCAIADFLDRKTTQIDTLVDKKRAVIEKLKEKRLALISRTITQGLPPEATRTAGLNTNSKLKPSGIEWLGDVPEHWKVLPFKRLCSRVDVGIAEAATHAYSNDGVPIIRSTNVRPNLLDTSDILRIEPWFAEKNRSKTLYYGDLVTVRTGYPGTTAVIPMEFDGSQCFTLVMSRLKRTEVPRFFSYFFNADPGVTYFQMEGWGTAQTNISVPIVQHLPVVRPPAPEQAAIVDFLDCETAKIDRMVAKVEEAIERLQEYRTATITAAVTGKIDVRGKAT